MQKMTTSEKINISFSVLTMIFVAFIGWGDRSASSAANDASQTEQIKYLTTQVQELKESFKDLAQEVHGLMAHQYSMSRKGKSDANI